MKVGDLVRDYQYPYIYGLVTDTTSLDIQWLVMVLLLGESEPMPYSVQRLEIVQKENT